MPASPRTIHDGLDIGRLPHRGQEALLADPRPGVIGAPGREDQEPVGANNRRARQGEDRRPRLA
jgi:hypothetical protein